MCNGSISACMCDHLLRCPSNKTSLFSWDIKGKGSGAQDVGKGYSVAISACDHVCLVEHISCQSFQLLAHHFNFCHVYVDRGSGDQGTRSVGYAGTPSMDQVAVGEICLRISLDCVEKLVPHRHARNRKESGPPLGGPAALAAFKIVRRPMRKSLKRNLRFIRGCERPKSHVEKGGGGPRTPHARLRRVTSTRCGGKPRTSRGGR